MTGRIKDANAGGQGSRVWARAGYDAIMLEGKPTVINEVLVNLIKNALEAMPDGGTLTVASYISVVTEQGPTGEQPCRLDICWM